MLGAKKQGIIWEEVNSSSDVFVLQQHLPASNNLGSKKTHFNPVNQNIIVFESNKHTVKDYL